MFYYFRRVVRSGLLIAAVLGAHAEALPAQETDTRAPVPDAAAQENVLALVREIHGKEYDGAKTSSQKLALAKTLLSEAGESQDDPTSHFVLLRVARDLAVKAGETKMALQTVDEMAKAFQIDGLTMKVATVTKLVKTARSAEQKKSLATSTVDLIDEAIDRDNYDLANQLVDVARKTRDRTLVKQIAARRKEIAKAAKAHAEVQEVLATLEEHPVDPDANLAAGKYFCFVKGNWEKGIPMLALGSDATLKALAVMELKGANSPSQQVKLADGWWEFAREADEATRKQLHLRAMKWYREALPEVTGILRLKIEKRVKDVEASAIQSASIEPSTEQASSEESSSTRRSRRPKSFYLDDIQEVDSQVGYGKLGKHGDQGYQEPKAKFQGVVPTHSLSVHGKANDMAYVAYVLDGKFRTFAAEVGILDQGGGQPASPLTFKVFGDGKLLWESQPVPKRGAGQDCSVKIKGVRLLRLQVDCPGDSNQARAIWISPRVSR